MLAADEVATESAPEFYQVQAFLYFSDENVSKYDFRTKSLDTAIDLMVAITGRPAYKDDQVSMSLTIGVLTWSADAIGSKRAELKLRECLDIYNWKIQ
jgi:hypothetical protein